MLCSKDSPTHKHTHTHTQARLHAHGQVSSKCSLAPNTTITQQCCLQWQMDGEQWQLHSREERDENYIAR